MIENTRFRRMFKRFAAVGSVILGAMFGVGYLLLTYIGDDNDARFVLAFLFASAGIMGVGYFVIVAKGRRTLPLLGEMLKLFFALWFLIGVVFILRALGNDPPPEPTSIRIIVYFFVGTIAGTVWMFALMLAIGIKQNIATWEVVRFPTAVKDETLWIVHVVSGGRWGRRLPREEVPKPRTTDERLDHAEEEAEDRFAEGELEKHEVRDRLNRAALVSRGELEAVEKKLDNKLDEAISLLQLLVGEKTNE